MKKKPKKQPKQRLERLNISSVSILGVTYKVRFKDVLIDTDTNEEVSGLCHRSQRLIEISLRENPTLAMQASSLIHEIVHAILYVSGHGEFFEEKQEEALTLALENGIYNVLNKLVRLVADKD